MTDIFKRIWPYAAAIVLFIAISFAYFSPVLQGKQLPQMDNEHAKGMAQELVEHEAKTGEKAMWTNSMFSGMPAYQIKGDNASNIYAKINKAVRLGLPFQTVAILFLYLLGFYLLLLSFKVDKWMSAIGAMAFAFGSYNLIIIIVGHITKAYAIGMMAPVIAGIVYAYNKNRYVGGLLTAIALGAEIAYNHVQVTYYLALIVMVIIISKFIYAIIDKALNQFVKTSAVLLLAVVLAILPNLSNLLATQEYGEFSNRGKNELSSKNVDAKVSTGLDKDYAFAWSYGKHETWTLLVPNVVGGGSRALGDNKEAMSAVTDPQAKEILAQQFTQYWGGRGFTEGPVYLGAIVCFLFLLGAFYYSGRERWWLIAATVLSILLAWGKNYSVFNDFMFYHFPLYNKFRTVEMALIMASVTVPLLAFLGLKEVYNRPELIKNNSKWFLIAFGLTGGISLLFNLMPNSFFNFIASSEMDAILGQKAQMPQHAAMFDLLIEQLKLARTAMLKVDAMRSFIFILLASASLWFFATNKLSGKYLLGGLAMLILIDMWGIDKRYLNDDDFVNKREANSFVASTADKAILKDSAPYYRVVSLFRDPFKDANTSFFHRTIGGYHGAKLRRYQDLYDNYGYNEWMQLRELLQKGDPQLIDDYLKTTTMLNLFNTKYLIYNPDATPIVNGYAMGNAWFVSKVSIANTPDAEIEQLGQVDLRTTAIIEKGFSEYVSGYQLDTVSGSINLTAYAPDKLTFVSSTTQKQLAIFSDIYYPKGWNAYVDGQPIDIFRANYVTRALMIPAGNHTIEFRFEPQSVKTGKILGYTGSLIILLLMGYFAYYKWKNRQINTIK